MSPHVRLATVAGRGICQPGEKRPHRTARPVSASFALHDAESGRCGCASQQTVRLSDIRHPTVGAGHSDATELRISRAEQAEHPRMYFQASQRARVSATLRNATAGKPSGASRQATVNSAKLLLLVSLFPVSHCQYLSHCIRNNCGVGSSSTEATRFAQPGHPIVLPAWRPHHAPPSTPDRVIAGHHLVGDPTGLGYVAFDHSKCDRADERSIPL